MDAAAAKVWADPDAPACCLLALGADRHPETEPLPGGGRHLVCLNWTLQTWIDEIRHDCGDVLHPRNVDRLGAALARLHNPDEYFHGQSGFSDIVLGLAAAWFDGNHVGRRPSTEEIAAGMIEAHLVAPPDDDERFSDSVARLVAEIARHEGYGRMPRVLKDLGMPPVRDAGWMGDMSTDPELFAIATAGFDDREADLDHLCGRYVADVAGQLAELPLKRTNPRPIAEQLLRFGQGLLERV